MEDIIEKAGGSILPKVYDDLVHPSATKIGDTMAKTVDVVLAPLNGLLWGIDKLKAYLEKTCDRWLDGIPMEERKSPNPLIAVPLLEALQYSTGDETISEMYLKLLRSAVDKRMERKTHPLFVDTIKNMSPLDAKLFNRLNKDGGLWPLFRPCIKVDDSDDVLHKVAPTWYSMAEVEGYSIFELSASIERLSILGLLQIDEDKLVRFDYDEFLTAKPLLEVLGKWQVELPSVKLELDGSPASMFITEYGADFYKVCMA